MSKETEVRTLHELASDSGAGRWRSKDPELAIAEAYDTPVRKIRDWRNYVPEEIWYEWDDLSTESRLIAYYFASMMANNEQWD